MLFIDSLFLIVQDFHSLKPIIYVLSEVMKRKPVNSYCFIIISNCYDFHVLFCSEYHQK